MTITIPGTDELFGLFAIFCVGVVIGVFAFVLMSGLAALTMDAGPGDWFAFLRWPVAVLAFVGGIVWAVWAA